MLFGISSKPKRDVKNLPAAPVQHIAQDDAAQEADQRRLLYERIARGHAMADAEERALRKRRGS